jgi:hypothetical protein
LEVYLFIGDLIKKKVMTLLIDGNRGIYVPQEFAKTYGKVFFPNEDLSILLDPDHEEYWERWDEIVDLGFSVNSRNMILFQEEGDLFMGEEPLRYTIKIEHDRDPKHPWEDGDCEPPIYYEYGRNSSSDYGCRDYIRGMTGMVTKHTTMDELVELCIQNEIPYYRGETRGYSQGDWADVLVIVTPEWVEKTGAPQDTWQSQMEGAVKLLGHYAWGDVYGFVVSDQYGDEHDSCWGFYGSPEEVKPWMAESISKEILDTNPTWVMPY